MFPKDLRFHNHPIQLMQAIETLPIAKGQLRQANKKSSVDLRNKLLQVPVEKMKMWKMKAQMLELLPYLAAETKNIALRERVVVISIASMENFSQVSLERLVPYLYQEHDFILALNARWLQNPPKSDSWFHSYYKMFRSKQIAQEISNSLLAETDDISKLPSKVRINRMTPLYNEIIGRFAKNYDWKKIKTCSFVSMIELCQIGISLAVKQKILLEMFREYTVTQLPNSVLQEASPLRELLSIALDVFGSCTVSIWNQIPEAKRLARFIELGQELENSLSISDNYGRLAWWKQWIETIDDVVIHRPSGLICIYGKDFVCVETFASEQRMVFYDKTDFVLLEQEKCWGAVPFVVSLEGLVIMRAENWQAEMNKWMRSRGYQKGASW